jgi:tRNA threonylcarbamoyladenosine biosynthesis protein TsaB
MGIGMKLLALDTSTEQCSVALMRDDVVIERCVRTARGHADLVLGMVDEVMREASLALRELDGIAFGRGPGGFTGVRIGVGVAQGLAFGAGLPALGVSDLAAVASQAMQGRGDVLVCMDARMGEVYWAVFRADGSGRLAPLSTEQVGPPASVVWNEQLHLVTGMGFAVYPELRDRFSKVAEVPDVLPRASDIVKLAQFGFRDGHALPARDAQPSYVRNDVAVKPTRHI